MGHRANLAIIDGPIPELYYSQWRASSLDVDLFWGPSYAKAFIRSQMRQPNPAEFLAADWVEGGAIIDCRRRTVLWYGGGEIRYHVPRRRLHLALMSGLWPGWHVRWAAEGAAEIADYLGVSREATVEGEGVPGGDRPWVFETTEDPTWNSTVISCVRDGSLGFAATDWSVEELIDVGPSMLDAMRSATLDEALDWSGLGAQFPTGGIHLDFDEQRLSYWVAEAAPSLAKRVRTSLPQWSVSVWGDRFESQLEAGQGALVIKPPDPAELLKWLQAHLLGDAEDFSDPVSSIISRLDDNDGIVVPADARIAQASPPDDERRRLLASVVPPAPGP